MSGRAGSSGAAVAPSRSSCTRNKGFSSAQCFAWAVAGLLATSATLKTWAAIQTAAGARETAAFGVSNSAVALTLAVCVIEYALAGWLISGRRQQGAWLACTFVFSTFLGVSAHAIWKGAAGCGCFGRIPVPPWVTSICDVAVLAGSLTTWTDSLAIRSPSKLAHLREWLMLIVSGALCGIITSSELPMVEVISSANGSLVVLDPERWRGRVMPLLKEIDIGNRLKTGKWQLILVRHTCPVCRALVDELMQRPRSPYRTPIAIIDVPPMTSEPSPTTAIPGYVLGRLSERQKWFVETPAVILIENGIVKEVSRTLPDEYR